MTEENKRLLALGKPILQPYQLWLLKVPNEHSSDILPPKTRPVMILETYFDKSDFEDDDFDASQVFPDFVVGTTNMRYIDWKGTLAFTDAGDLSAMKLRKPTVFRFDQVVERNLQADLSVKDIMENGTFISDVPEEIRKRIHDYINDLGIANLKLPESLLRESKADIQSFTDKFGDDTYDTFKKSSQRLKNAGMSADMLTYVHDDSMSKDKLDKILFNLANHIKTDKNDMSKIDGKYKYLGSAKGYDVYQPLDAESSMNLGVGSGWCTTGRYGHYGEDNFNPSLKDAKKHWNAYTSRGVKFFYFLQHGKGKYALALYPKILDVGEFIPGYYLKQTNFELYDAPDNLTYDALKDLPLNLVPEKIVIDETKLKKDDSGKLTLSEDGKKLIRVDSDIVEAVIPDSVTSIGDWASDCSSLESIVIPDSITSIGKGAFANCSSLESVTIPNSVTSIGMYAFYGCSSLKSIVIPDSITSIGKGAFSDCSSLESITVGPKLYDQMKKEYGDIVHSSDENEESVTESMILESKADIQSFTDKFGDDTYAEFRKSSQRLKNAGMSTDMLSYVRDDTMDKKKLDDILFNLANKRSVDKEDPSRIEGKYKFLGSAKGYDVYQPLDAESSMNLGVGSGWCTTGRYGHYGEENFKPSLKDAEKHWNEYTSKGVKFFYFLQNGKGMYALAVYPRVLNVNKYVDDNSYFIKKANVELYDAPDNLDYEDLNKLPLELVPEKIVLDKTKLKKDDSGKLTLSEDGKTLMKADTGIENAKIPDGVTSIGYDSFLNCYSLKSVTIPDSVTSIGESAFSKCSSLESIVIPDSITSIGRGAFSDCSSLESIVIPDSVTSIGTYAFYDCRSLESIVIPDSVTSIGEGAFSGCGSLKSVTIPSTVTSIGDYAFSNCRSLESIVIPDSVTSIGEGAFWSCSSLKSVAIPDSVTSIGTYAFLNDRYLRSIKVRRAGGTSYAYDTLGAKYGYSIVTYDSAPVTESLPGNEVPHPEAYYIDASGRIIPVENHMDYDNDHPDEAEDNGYVRVRVKGFKLIEFPGSPTDEQMRAIADAVKAMGHVGSVSLNVRGSGLPGEDVSLRGDSVSRVMISVEDMIHPF